MQFLLDNAAAALVTGTLFLMLVVVTHRSQKAQVQASSYYALRQQQVNFIETLRGDMVGVTEVKDIAEDGNDRFTFVTRLGNETSTTEVTYQRVQVGERDGEPLYQIRRFEDTTPCSTCDYDGGSMPTITSWEILARNEDGNPIGDASKIAETTQIHVRFSFVLPFEGTGNETMSRRRWEATYQPSMISSSSTL